MTDFGFHLVGGRRLDLYLNGAYQETSCVHTVPSGGSFGIASHWNLGFGKPHVDRLEVRSGGPGGTLEFAEDFAGLGAWTQAYGINGSWSISPAGFAYYPGSGGYIYRADPLGDYYELKGVTFDDPTGPENGWVMIVIRDQDPADQKDTSDPSDSIRVAYAPESDDLFIYNGAPCREIFLGQIQIGPS